MKRRGDYGFDAPYALVTFAALGAASVVAAIAASRGQDGHHLARMMGFYSAFFLGNALSFLYTTRHGKFQVWDKILDELHASLSHYRGCP
jgi:arsenite methyltransferase